ncbi:Sterigmatocystin 8-O-methyltransferase [Sphaceloma murrayae]|uniref:Sterigmatocystin 8-O-methyltransferase n=1 Tax=Sphaceloma murrayae TaxID=2082308 RepID=A0A2K1QGP9_9PEZI|nr:Sterigmatocystin 8-O-methyltransferase [Sphaceloma murrayae]
MASPTPVAKTDDLTELLKILTQNVEAYLSVAPHPPSLSWPSKTDPLAEPIANGIRQQVVRSAEKILALVAGPREWVMKQASGYLTPAALLSVMEMNILKYVSEDRTKPTSIDELASRTGASPLVLTRLLKMLTHHYIFEEVENNKFAHNAMSKFIQIPEIESYVAMTADETAVAAAHLAAKLKATGYRDGVGRYDTAFQKAFNTHLDLFEWMALKEKSKETRFADAMTAWENFPVSTINVYPWADLPDGATVVDIGGGTGHISATLSKTYPHLRFVIQDFEKPLSLGKEKYAQTHPKIEWQVHDAYTPNPRKGADVYYIRHAIHDHDDSECVILLGNCVKAMGKNSRILVHDMVVPDAVGEDLNYHLLKSDLVELVLLNGIERTLQQWKNLAKATHEKLEVVKIWRRGDSVADVGAVIEFRMT